MNDPQSTFKNHSPKFIFIKILSKKCILQSKEIIFSVFNTPINQQIGFRLSNEITKSVIFTKHFYIHVAIYWNHAWKNSIKKKKPKNVVKGLWKDNENWSTLNIIFTKDNVFQRPLYCKKNIIPSWRVILCVWIKTEPSFSESRVWIYSSTVYVDDKKIANIIFFWLVSVLNIKKPISFSITSLQSQLFPNYVLDMALLIEKYW